MLRIIYQQQNKKDVFTTEKNDIVIGRAKDGVHIDLDLSPDQQVSRPHARIWFKDSQYWIEDLKSKCGTLIQDLPIKGKHALRKDDQIKIGETLLQVEIPDDQLTQVVSAKTVAHGNNPNESAAGIQVGESLDASRPAFASQKTNSQGVEQQLALLFELPLQLGAETHLDKLLQLVVERMVAIIPGAARGALLLRDRQSDGLLLKAFVSKTGPSASETLARRAMQEGKGFIWQRDEAGDVGGSISHHKIETGMYAPLMWQDKPLGAICVDNPERASQFRNDDLTLMVAVARYAAMAVANHYAQDDLKKHSDFTHRLICSRFPPRLRASLMRQASTGSLLIGTRQSMVTVLISDIRGFTQLSAAIGAQRMNDLLNEYFPPLVDAIFKYNGTIEKFVGDAIFAVFGSPDPDDQQQENAVRAALAMQEVVARLNASRKARDAATCGMGVGIDCGEVLHGFIGDADRIEYAVVGDAANFASRYCNGAGVGEVLISPAVHSRVWNLVIAESTNISTKHEGDIPAHRVKSLKQPALYPIQGI